MEKRVRRKALTLFPREVILTSTNTKVKEVTKRLDSTSFLDRIRNYTETYWDQAWHNWRSPDALRD